MIFRAARSALATLIAGFRAMQQYKRSAVTPSIEPVLPMPGRTWEDQLAIRWPRAYKALAKAVSRLSMRLPVGSRLRRALLRRVVKRSYNAWNRKDRKTLLGMYREDVVWDNTEFKDWPDTQVYLGHEGIRQFFDDLFAAFGEFHGEVVDVIDLGQERAVTFAELRFTGAGSGVEISRSWTQVGTGKDGLFAEVRNFSDRSEALAYAGLSEQAVGLAEK